ncbi:hypothetical protein DIPPA_70016 [Diplonema papillatum]|nr:hypothetical protein DIPPA_70016 [Diplonema papillatum]
MSGTETLEQKVARLEEENKQLRGELQLSSAYQKNLLEQMMANARMGLQREELLMQTMRRSNFATPDAQSLPTPPQLSLAGFPSTDQPAQTPCPIVTQEVSPRRGQNSSKGGCQAIGTSRRNSKAGEALQRNSRTPSRPPDHTEVVQDETRKLVSEKKLSDQEKRLPPPIDRRRKHFTSEDIVTLQEHFMKREAAPAVHKESLIPQVWKPTGATSRLLATFGLGEGAEASEEPPRKIQRVDTLASVKAWSDSQTLYMVFTIFIRDDLSIYPPSMLAAFVKTLAQVSDADLRILSTSIEKRSLEHSTSILTYLHTIIVVLLWYSADAVADALEVCARLLRRHVAADASGQAEMLEVASRLSTVSPPDAAVSFEGQCAPYAVSQSTKRVQVLASGIHSVLQQKIDST